MHPCTALRLFQGSAGTPLLCLVSLATAFTLLYSVKPSYNIPPSSFSCAAVLDGITTSTSKHAETPADRLQMGFILHDLLTGKEPEDEDEPKPEDGVAEPKTEEGGTGTPAPSAEVGQAEEVKPEEASKIVEVTETESVP